MSHEGKIFEIKNDDGETGAGAVILRLLQHAQVVNTIVVVTRWYGGIKLGTDRYKHVQDATKYFLREAKI
jgi:putative IMPACT (imprinted ancient) family translation regulator